MTRCGGCWINGQGSGYNVIGEKSRLFDGREAMLPKSGDGKTAMGCLSGVPAGEMVGGGGGGVESQEP